MYCVKIHTDKNLKPDTSQFLKCGIDISPHEFKTLAEADTGGGGLTEYIPHQPTKLFYKTVEPYTDTVVLIQKVFQIYVIKLSS